MDVDKTIKGNTAILYPKGRMDVTIANTFEKDVNAVIGDSTGCNIIFNMKDVTYLSSSGLRVITNTMRQLKEDNRKFACCDVGESVMAVFNATNMLDIITIFSSEDEALSNIAQ